MAVRMYVRLFVILTAALCFASCRHAVEQTKVRELAAVAKDWCLTIRASQVLPVYPLTEDLQVGDMFLVSSPIEEEVHDLEQDGFLPLDNVIARLQPVGWQQFYNGAYNITQESVLPKQWQFPQPPPSQAPYTAWSTAPGAAFPSYTFQVKKGAGAMLAIPIQAVPVGLSLLGASDATGTVNISNASTYGLPVTVLAPQVEEWAVANRDFLKQYPPRVQQDRVEQHYVRTVYRIYVAGGMNVSLINNDSFGARGDAGASKPVAMLNAGGATESANAATNYASVLSSLSQSVASTTPGANLTLSSASSNSVAMNETFPRPLVIGYLAFDRAINDDGTLGPPIPTHARVTNKVIAPATAVYGSDGNADRIRVWLNANASNRKTLQDWLAPRAPDVSVPVFLNGGQYAQLRATAISELRIQ
jgi:hypothetical protein